MFLPIFGITFLTVCHNKFHFIQLKYVQQLCVMERSTELWHRKGSGKGDQPIVVCACVGALGGRVQCGGIGCSSLMHLDKY